MKPALLAVFAAAASAHTLVRVIYVNGVDQGTNYGVRPPAMNGPPRPGEPPFTDGSDSGTGSWPVRNLTLPDLRCNIFGEKPAADWIQVVPGDVVSFEWGHRSRLSSDGIIEASHKGAVQVYIAELESAPTKGWTKIFEEGEYSRDQWAVVPKLRDNRGVHSVRIPAGLRDGRYLLRPELVTLHEADVAHDKNNNRGVQIYTECVQVAVRNGGAVALPQGIQIPGPEYRFTSPGIVYNLYGSPRPAYTPPGPRVWAGAAPSVPNPKLGEKKGPQTYTRWSTWVGSMDRTVTWSDAQGKQTKTAYAPVWPTAA